MAAKAMLIVIQPGEILKKKLSSSHCTPVIIVLIMLASRIPLPLPPKYRNDTPEQYLERLMSFYKEYHWLIHVLAFNFVTQKEWEKFPQNWREALMKRIEDTGDNWAYAILDLTSEKSDYVSYC